MLPPRPLPVVGSLVRQSHRYMVIGVVIGEKRKSFRISWAGMGVPKNVAKAAFTSKTNKYQVMVP